MSLLRPDEVECNNCKLSNVYVTPRMEQQVTCCRCDHDESSRCPCLAEPFVARYFVARSAIHHIPHITPHSTLWCSAQCAACLELLGDVLDAHSRAQLILRYRDIDTFATVFTLREIGMIRSEMVLVLMILAGHNSTFPSLKCWATVSILKLMPRCTHACVLPGSHSAAHRLP